MNKLKELIKGRMLPVNVCCNDPLLKDIYYTITHKNEQYALATCYYKENKLKVTDSSVLLSSENWELYEEPKKKVKVALYVYKRKETKHYIVTDEMYKDDLDFGTDIYNVDTFKRLDWSEIEVLDE